MSFYSTFQWLLLVAHVQLCQLVHSKVLAVAAAVRSAVVRQCVPAEVVVLTERPPGRAGLSLVAAAERGLVPVVVELLWPWPCHQNLHPTAGGCRAVVAVEVVPDCAATVPERSTAEVAAVPADGRTMASAWPTVELVAPCCR